jgi:hypothetical protein
MMQTVNTRLDTSNCKGWSDESRYEELYKILGLDLLRVKSVPQIGTVMVLDQSTIRPTRWEQVMKRVKKDYPNADTHRVKLELTLLSIEQRIFSPFDNSICDLELDEAMTLVFKMDIKF